MLDREVMALRKSMINVYEGLAYLSIAGAIFYIGMRAYSLSITHDEAITCLFHATLPFSDIFTNAGRFNKSNNHLLNTLLIKIFIKLFGLHEFTVRLPALIGGILYVIGTYKILKLFLDKWLLVAGILLMICNPFILDYLSIARGYALGLGFLMFGLYYLFRRIYTLGGNRDRYESFLATTMLAISTLANLTFLNVYLTAICLLVLLEISEVILQKKSPDILKTAFFVFPGMFLLFLIYYRPVMLMKQLDEFYFGGSNGFWQDTVTSLISATLYSKKYGNWDTIFFIKIWIIMMLVLAGLTLFFAFQKENLPNLLRNYLLWMSLMLLICSAGIILQHLLFNTLYVIERTAIFFIPMFFLYVLALWKNILPHSDKKYIRAFMVLIFYIPSAALILHFINSANFRYYNNWKYDANTKKVIEQIAETTSKYNLPPDTIRLGVTWLFKPSMNFYIVKDNLTWIRKFGKDNPSGAPHFYYFTSDDKKAFEQRLDQNYALKIIEKFDLTDTYLAILETAHK
ncbi:MAG: glycosyltransferase family 39 protein [Nitrospirae bacterium]|nr:glycosyltransferase family 39 protein [Nitrospirota bacterium]